MEHYVYIHYKQDTKEPFYIGKGNKKRYKQTTGRSEYWKRIVNKYGFYSEIHSYYETHEEALIKEIELIKEYKELTKPIAPENAIGRISRMDAINNNCFVIEIIFIVKFY